MQAPGLFINGRDARGKYGLVHNIGLGGAVVISLLRRPGFYRASGPDGRDRYFSVSIQCSYVLLGPVSLGWDITMPMRYDRVRGRIWTKSCPRRIRKVCYTPRSCDHALLEAKCCTDSVIGNDSGVASDHRWLRVCYLDISADADKFIILYNLQSTRYNSSRIRREAWGLQCKPGDSDTCSFST
jgi:hypothetical protein